MQYGLNKDFIFGALRFGNESLFVQEFYLLRE